MKPPLPRSPDGERYWQMGAGVRQPLPFHLRWAMPYVCSQESDLWRAGLCVSLAASCALAWAYTGAWAAAFMPLGLAGVIVLTKCVLVDLPAQVLALGAAVAWQSDHSIGSGFAVGFVAALAGCVSEKAPLFAAVYAWSPWPLIGLAAPLLRRVLVKPAQLPAEDVGDEIERRCAAALHHPLSTALSVRRAQWKHVDWFVLPWGVLVLGFVAPTWQLAAVLVLAYGQLFLATDLVRLYTWAWPVLALRTFDVVPRSWWLLLVLLHLASPFKGEGF